MRKTKITDLEILKILNKNNVDLDFGKKTLDEISKIKKEIDKSNYKNRLDLREKLIVTIDGDDTKDIDDAISLEILENGNFYLGVHIADVTHYVREGSMIDRLALNQGTSIYPVNGVVPMLPEILSNNVCSLNPNVDRLTLSCFIEIDFKGDVVNYSIKETIINSKNKLTYSIVNNILEHRDKELIEKYNTVYPMLLDFEKLTKILINKRDKRGSLDLNCSETKFYCDNNNNVIDVCAYERNLATRLIEESMIICNETIANHCKIKQLPFLYRVHDYPKEEKMEKFKMFVSELGFQVNNKKLKTKEIQKLLKKIKDTPEENAIHYLLLRSLPKAIYVSDHSLHYGLASDCYCHFTSPIRRYPDLMIHRIIKADLNNLLDYKKMRNYKKIVRDIDTHCSNKEQEAQEIERETVKLKAAQYMTTKIGEEFSGIISGISEYGLYITLPNTIEGVVNIYSLKDDKYTFDEYKLVFVGENTRKIIKLGQCVDVIVKCVNINNNYQIELKIK